MLISVILDFYCNKNTRFMKCQRLYCRYFPKEATQEILDEIFPKLFPLDTGKICGAFDLLSIFLNPLQGHELWLTNFVNLWNTYHNPSWNVVSKSLNL